MVCAISVAPSANIRLAQTHFMLVVEVRVEHFRQAERGEEKPYDI